MSEMPRVCLPAELAGKARQEAAKQAIKDREDNSPSWQAVQEIARPEGAVFLTGALWPQNREIKASFINVSDSDEDKIRHDLEELYAYSNLALKWVVGNGEIRISRDPNSGSWSYMGSQALQVRSGATMNLGWLDGGVVLHEGGHSLGMGHGHKNPKTEWKWNEEAVIRDLSGPPNNWSEEQIRHNVLNRYTAEEVTASNPDYDSVMAYTVPNDWTIGDYEVSTNDNLSAGDIEWLGKMYPIEKECPPKPSLSETMLDYWTRRKAHQRCVKERV